MLFDQPVSRICRIGTLVMQSCINVFTASEIQKAALHLEPRVSAHLLCGQLVLGFLVKSIGTGHIAHLAAEVCQTSQSVPGPLALQDFYIAVLRHLIAAVLKFEI